MALGEPMENTNFAFTSEKYADMHFVSVLYRTRSCCYWECLRRIQRIPDNPYLVLSTSNCKQGQSPASRCHWNVPWGEACFMHPSPDVSTQRTANCLSVHSLFPSHISATFDSHSQTDTVYSFRLASELLELVTWLMLQRSSMCFSEMLVSGICLQNYTATLPKWL